MKTYGPITYSTGAAPQLFTGLCENYSIKAQQTTTEIQGYGEIAALVVHAAKNAISFASNPPASVTALGLRAGAAFELAGTDAPAAGLILCHTSAAKWQKGQAMVMDVQATNYPDIPADTAPVGTITPGAIVLAYGTAPLQLPVGKIWWGVSGLAPFTESGIVQSCSISESVQIQEEEGSGVDLGNIIALAIHTYKATASMEVLTTDSMPELNTTLSAFGNFQIIDAEPKWSRGASRMIQVNGILIPGVTA